MQIPGLNLLNGKPPPAISADRDKLPSLSTAWPPPLPTTATFAGNDKAEISQAITPPSEILDGYHLDSAGVTSGIANAESSIMAPTSNPEAIDPDADPLDVALAQISDISSAESGMDNQPDDSDSDSDNERYSSLIEVY